MLVDIFREPNLKGSCRVALSKQRNSATNELDYEFKSSPISQIRKFKRLLTRTLEPNRRLFWQSLKFPDPTPTSTEVMRLWGQESATGVMGAKANYLR